MFERRSYELEIIDTDDYTPAEYEQFLREIRWINRWLGDEAAFKNTVLREIEIQNRNEFSILDVGAGSGELLRVAARRARRNEKRAALYGLELNARSAAACLEESQDFPEIRSIRGDALALPFADDSFDYAVCSLFTHHFTDERVVEILREMRRVARRKVFVIDLHRNPTAHFFYTTLGKLVIKGRLARHDGALSILRSFVPDELQNLGAQAGLSEISVTKHFPSRLVLTGKSDV